MDTEQIRNVAVIAHVDHGKTTLVDRLLYQSGMFRHEDLDKLAGGQHGLIMDSNPLERERGITIFSKNCSIGYVDEDSRPIKINIIDTPGHADFGGEVERVLSMADGALLLVDAFEGPMPQTRFVLQKALGYGLRPIVLVNKVDRSDARPDLVVDEVFDLLVDLGADDETLDFPVIYASGRDGWATKDLESHGDDLRPVLDAILTHVPPPQVNVDSPLRLLVTTLDYSEFVGRIAIGRVGAGVIHTNDEVAVLGQNVIPFRRRVAELLVFEGLGRKKVESVAAGDICAVVGLDPIHIGDTLSDPEDPGVLDSVPVDEPTLHMTFRVNDGPFAGRDGKFVTSRQIRERLERELLSNVALRVSPGKSTDQFNVSGRGLMHIGILLENMRRDGYEVCVGKPRVITKEIDGEKHEPIELLVIDVPVSGQNSVMSLIGNRRAEIVRMDGKPGASGFVHLEFTIPARGLVGLRGRMMTATQGEAIMHHSFHSWGPWRGDIPRRNAGVMAATDPGRVTPYALDALDDRGFFFVKPGEDVYEGQIVGEHNREKDIAINVVKMKKLTNIRTHSKDEAASVRPAREMSLEAALEYIQEDELVEVTPAAIRMRKRLLREAERRRESRKS
jgi:GTP-binding protein